MGIPKPRKPPGPKPVNQALLQIRLPLDMKQRAIERAAAEGEKLSDRIRRLILDWLDRRP